MYNYIGYAILNLVIRVTILLKIIIRIYMKTFSCTVTLSTLWTWRLRALEIRTIFTKWPTQFTLSVCIVMTFLLPYNVRCDALHLNCSIMISWNSFALHNRILGDSFQGGKISLCIILHKLLCTEYLFRFTHLGVTPI